MEAVNKPIELESNKGNNDISLKMKDIKCFHINLENKPYIFEFAKSENKENIIFKISENIPSLRKDNFYLLYLNINEFNKLNAIFSLYQNIDEIYSFLLNLINDKKYSVSLKNKSIILTIKLPMPGGKIIDINLELIENKIGKEELIENLYITINELIKENQLIKNEQKLINNEMKNKDDELNNVKNELKNLKTENEQIKNKLKNIEEVLGKIILENKNEFYDFDKSKIIKNNQEKIKLKEWISFNGKIKKIKLLYRATEDGDNIDAFYEKCGNKGPTISLIQTKKGRRFGGFTKANWIYSDNAYKDNSAFLFSLNEMKKYNILKPELAIRCFSGSDFLAYGNNCDGYGIFLKPNFKKNKGVENHSTRVYDVPSDYCLSGEYRFDVEEVEVFQIIYE